MDKDIPVGSTAPEHKQLIGGHWLQGQEWYEVQDKLAGGVMASVPVCEDEMCEMAVLAACDAVPALSTMSTGDRTSLLNGWAEQVDGRRAALARMLHRESAIPLVWADIEVEKAAEALRRAASESEHAVPESVPALMKSAEAVLPADLTMRHPVGIVGAILPDRHPLFYAAQLAGASMITGCPVVLLCPPLVPLAVMELMQLGSRQPWPPGSLNLIFGSNRDLGQKLAKDSRVTLVVLAGSTRDAGAFGKVRGQRPLISVGAGFGCALVDRSADVTQVVTGLLAMRFRRPHIGRVPVHFVLAPESLTSRLNDALTAGVQSLTAAAADDPAAEVPWQITESLARRAEEWLQAMVQSGGIVVCGGQRRGSWIAPALIVAPAGLEAVEPPPPHAPFLIVDSYDKRPGRQLSRFPDIEEVSIFTSDVQSALELIGVPNVSRVDVYTTRSGQSTSRPGSDGREQIQHLIAGMTRRKRVELHLAG